MAVDVNAQTQNGRFSRQNTKVDFPPKQKARFSRQILKLVLRIFALKPNM